MSGMINDDIIQKVNDSSDLVDIVSKYLSLKRTGGNYVGLCPFHNEKTPSFTVSKTKQLFHCFGCGEGGDAISFIMKMENLSFIDAVKFLAREQGIPLEEGSSIDKELISQKEKIYEINREAARFYYYNLINNEKTLKYLKDRNINRKTLNRFGLGYAVDSWNSIYRYLQGKGYSVEDIEKAGLIARRRDGSGYYDKFRNRLMFPIIDTRGRVIGFGGRVLDDSMPKYLNTQDTIVFTKGNNLYGLNLIKDHSNREKIILVEGYMDVIALFGNGIDYGVAGLGTAFTPNQVKLLKRYGKEIYICYDSDTAGIKATMKTLKLIRKEGVEPKIIVLPSGKDPDDFINEYGLKEFQKLLDESLNHIEYEIYIYKKKYDLSDVEDKIKFTKEIAKTLRGLKSPIEKDVYIDKVSMDTGISREAIQKEVLGKKFNSSTTIRRDKYINGKYRDNKNEIKPIKTVLEPAHLTAEKTLVKMMIKNRNYYNIIKEHLTMEDFFNYECRTLVGIICDEYENNQELVELDSSNLLEDLKGYEMDVNILGQIIDGNTEFLPEDRIKLIDDLVKTIKYYNLKIERERVTKRIQEIESSRDSEEGVVEEFKLLCLKLTELDKKLKSHI